VKANAEIIMGKITGDPPGMPPPPSDPFPRSFINAFTNWMKQGYPP